MDKTKPLKTARAAVRLSDINYTPILIALLVIIVTVIIYFLWKKKSFKKTDILLVGLCESGKTLLFSQLLENGSRETFTSIAENLGNYKSKETGKTVRVVDIPGHERLRARFFDQYKNFAKGIIFVIDSVTIQKDIRDVADFLYTILADNSVSSTPILILCNKQDATLAKGSQIVKNLLEKEINLVRTTRQKQLESVDNSSTERIFIGAQAKDFEFSQVSQPIDVAECSAQKSELHGVDQWLKTLL